MKAPAIATLAAFLSVALVAPGLAAGEERLVTLEGKIMCATCSTNHRDREHCQKLLIVEAEGEKQYYYVEQNDVEHRFGGDCGRVTRVRVTGTVSEKGNRMWVEARKITPLETEES